MILPDTLLNYNKELIHANPNYRRVRLSIQDKQLFGVSHNCDVRLAGQYYRAGILGGEYDAGDRELIFYFLTNRDYSLAKLNELITSIHSGIMLEQHISVSKNIIGCAVMELFMDDVLDNQIVVSDYVKAGNKYMGNHVWRFATPEEYEKYNIDMVEQHHNGVPVAAYQLEKDIRYYEWLADPALNGARQWVKDRLDKNLYHVVDYMRQYKVPVYMLAYQKHGKKMENTVICGRVEPNGDIFVGKEIARDELRASRSALA